MKEEETRKSEQQVNALTEKPPSLFKKITLIGLLRSIQISSITIGSLTILVALIRSGDYAGLFLMSTYFLLLVAIMVLIPSMLLWHTNYYKKMLKSKKHYHPHIKRVLTELTLGINFIITSIYLFFLYFILVEIYKF